MSNKYSTIRSYARESGVREWLIRRLVKEGRVRYFTSGNRAYIDTESVMETLAQLAESHGTIEGERAAV